jgi:hypothetical protein
MKNIKTILGISLTALFLSGCSDILEEQPRDIFEPGYFSTQQGIEGGLTALYSGLRNVYGQPYYYNATETGTDEYGYGAQGDQNFKNADLIVGMGIPDAANSRFDVLWNEAYSAINNASGVIANGEAAGMDAQLIAEAYFFRGFYYFQLVQAFGGVPLDLGGGELQFVMAPTRKSVRNTVPEVYTKAVFKDLQKAIDNLPETQRLTGTVTKNVARLALAKAYLTYAWWLENPNNIPTYPEAARTDPDGKSAQAYFQLAYDTALQGINNPGPYKLMPSFYDVNVWTNDRNAECMLYADHTEFSDKYSESNVLGWDGGVAQNQAVWMVTAYFQNTQLSRTKDTWSSFGAIHRTVKAGQSYSRQWMRMTPTIEAVTTNFPDKVNDSRFNGTFVTTYRATYTYRGYDMPDEVYGANFLPIHPFEKILSFIDEEPDNLDWSNSVYKSNIGAAAMPGRADFVIPLSKIGRSMFPGLWKLGVARSGTDYNDDKVASTRPFNIMKYSEFYFIAAEAAVKGASPASGMTARDLINVIRARAGKWTMDVTGYGGVGIEGTPKVEDHSEEMVALTPATIDIKYILAERSREYFGEGYRWYDLARTQMWEEIAGTYHICEIPGGEVLEIKRQIQPYLYLRPIPTGQLDALDGDEAYKKAYQNPGYL